MPTAVLDVELTALPPWIDGLERYGQARVLVRMGGRPAAWLGVPVSQGRVRGASILDALAAQAGADGGSDRDLLARLGLLNGAEAEAGAPATAHGGQLPSITVAVCTRDRPEDLRRCLEGLLRLPDVGQEVLVVDSASQGEMTRQVAAAFAGVRYLRVERPGLNVARNAALAAATGAVVAFIDDDAVPDENWVNAHRAAFGDALTLVSTGLTLPLELETPAQEQFEAFSPFSRGFRRREYDLRNMNPLTAGRAGAGVNMALRREVTARVGWFDEALDAGTPTHSGGETELFARVIAAGCRIVYTPDAINWHRHRRTLPELRRTIYGYGVGTYAFWTRRMLRNSDWAAVVLAAKWLRYDQLPRLVRSALRRPGAAPWPLPWDELRGCLAGPGAYLAARRALRESGAAPGPAQASERPQCSPS